jgi:hypothetical protein
MWGCSVVVRESNDLLVLSVAAPRAGIKNFGDGFGGLNGSARLKGLA